MKAALSGDSLVLSSGLFIEDSITIGKSLKLMGTISGAVRTVIQPKPYIYLPLPFSSDTTRSFIVFSKPKISGTTDTLRISDVDFTKGYARNSIGGGAIFADTGTILIIEGRSELYYNKTEMPSIRSPENSPYGGAIFSRGDVIIQGQAKIYSNTAYREGGGIYSTKSVLIKDQALVYANSAGSIGGGVFCAQSITVKDQAQIKANAGGGIYCEGNLKVEDDVVIFGNVGGPGIYASKPLTIGQRVKIDSNYSAGNGGGIFSLDTLIIKDSATISGNRAVNGAGVYSLKPIKISDRALLRRNYATQYGGAIVSGSNLLVEENVRIDSNTALFGGGGIYFTGEGILRDSVLVLCNNAATGAGIYAKDADLNLQNTVVLAVNKAQKYAGGIALLNAGLRMKDSVVIAGNSTDSNFAAGIYCKGTKDISIQSGQIIANHSTDSAVSGFGMAFYNDAVTGSVSSVIMMNKARIFNPRFDGSRQNEVYNNYAASSFISDSAWWGESDTSGLIYTHPAATFTLGSWIIAKWSLNSGLPIGLSSSFPLEAHFTLHTGAALPAGMFWMLKGIFVSDSGSFSPDTASMTATNTITSTYNVPYTSGVAGLYASVDADSFAKPVYVVGLGIESFKTSNNAGYNLFPNPVKEELMITNHTADPSVTLSLYNVQGQIVQLQQLNFIDRKVHVRLNVPEGIYFLRLQNSKGNSWIETVHVVK